MTSFSAWASGGYTIRSGIVKFNEVLSNPGGHYNSTTYKFTCPVDGMYYFTFTLFSSSKSSKNAEFSKLLAGSTLFIHIKVGKI